MRYGWREKVAANPAAANADADEVSSVTDANISLTIAMNQAVTMAGHPKMADRRILSAAAPLWRGCSSPSAAVRRPDPYAVTRQSYASPPSRTLHAAEITVLTY